MKIQRTLGIVAQMDGLVNYSVKITCELFEWSENGKKRRGLDDCEAAVRHRFTVQSGTELALNPHPLMNQIPKGCGTQNRLRTLICAPPARKTSRLSPYFP
jgi:hypothetical protein